jgi:hypothetical protein
VSELLLSVDVPVPADVPELSGLLDEYRSLYQPPPLSVNAVREINRSSAPPHSSQVVLAGSLIRWEYSNTFWH